MRNCLMALAFAMALVLITGCEPSPSESKPNADLKAPDVPPGRSSGGAPKAPGKK